MICSRAMLTYDNKCSAVAEMDDRLDTIDMGRKLGEGGCAPLFRGSWVPSNTMSLWLRPACLPSSTLIHPAVWPQQTWAENWGEGLWPFGGGGAGSPSNTMWRGPRPTSSPSFIWIHPTVWPQYTNVTDRTEIQTDNGPTAWGEPFYKRSPNKLFEDAISRNCSIPGLTSTTSEKFSLAPHSSSYRLIHYSFTARVTTTVILLTGKGGVRVSRQLQQ